MNIDITKKIKFLKLSQSSYDNLDIKDSYTFYKTEDNMYYEDLLLSYYNKTYNYYIAFYSVDDNSLNFCGVDEIPATGTQLLGKTVTTIYQGLDDTSTSTSTIPWYSNRTNFKSVIVDITFLKYQPSSIGLWFYGFTNLTTVDLSFLDTSQTTIMQSMFYNCSSLDSLDLSLLDTSKVTNISYMFYGCSKLTSLDLSNFDTSQVTTMSSMFYNCTSLTTIYSNDNNFVITKVTSGTNMFYNCSKLVGGNGTIYSSSSVSYTMAHIDTASNPGYFTNYLNNNNNNKFLSNSNTKKHKIKFLELSQSSYDNLNTKDSYTFYKTENDLYYENLLLSYEEKKYYNYIAVNIIRGDNVNRFDDDLTELLYFYGTNNMPMIGEWTTYGRIGDIYTDIENTTSASTIPWYSARFEFSRVIFDPTFIGARPTSTRFWFWDFNNCKGIEGLEYLNTSKVIDMSNMFVNCYLLSSINVSSFNTSNVTNMESMFYGCSNLISLDLSSFDISNVTTMWGMFAECTNLSSLNILSFNTYNVTQMGYMFFECSNLEILDLSSFDTSNVTGMEYIFNGDSNLITIYVNDSKFITEKSLEQTMFFGCTSLIGGNGTKYDSNKIDYTMAHVDTVNNPGYFTQGSIINFPIKENNIINRKIKFLELPQSSYDNLNVKDSYTFYKTKEKNMYFKDLLLSDRKYNYYIAFYSEDDESLNFCGVNKIPSENSQLLNKTVTTIWDTDVENVGNTRPSWVQTTIKYKHIIFDPTFIKAKPTSTYEWFCSTGRYSSCSEVESIEGLKYLDTSNVTDMAEMFAGCSSLTSLDLSSFNTHNVTTMLAMFDMYTDDGGKLISLDLSSFDTSHVTNMAYMFEMCNSLTSLNLSSFNTFNVTNMFCMFLGCTSLTSLDLSCFFTYSVTNMSSMFWGCSSLTSLDLTLLNAKSLYGLERINGTSSVTDMSSMFYNCTSLTTIYSIDMFFNIDNVTNSSNMFQNCTNLIGGNNTTYDSSKVNKSMAHVDTADNPGYFTQGNLLSNNTPVRIQKAVSRGIATDFWAVGDKVPITLNGTVDTLTFNNKTYYAFILGFNHNADLETEGKYSLTLGFGKTEDNIDIAFNSFKMNTSSTNVGGWESSYMRNTICPAFYKALPSEWQDVIGTITKYTDNVGGGNGSIETNVTATKDQIFLLGSYEIQTSTTSPNSYEKNYQQQYDYYAAGNDKIKYQHSITSSAINWWRRSPVYTNNTNFCVTMVTGDAGSGSSSNNYGFAPAFCIIGN